MFLSVISFALSTFLRLYFVVPPLNFEDPETLVQGLENRWKFFSSEYGISMEITYSSLSSLVASFRFWALTIFAPSDLLDGEKDLRSFNFGFESR